MEQGLGATYPVETGRLLEHVLDKSETWGHGGMAGNLYVSAIFERFFPQHSEEIGTLVRS